MASFGWSASTTDTEYRDKRFVEVEWFDQLCANLKARVVALHEGDLKTTQHLYRGIVVMAYADAKAKVLTRKPPRVEDLNPPEGVRPEWMTPEWRQYRYNVGELTRLMRKWRGITFKDIRQNSLNAKLKIPHKKLAKTPENLVE